MMRIGQSTDIHTLAPGKELIVGGISIPSQMMSVGHSDADCLLHAITESLLGALALGDLGTWFPDTDTAYKGIDSSLLLKEVVAHITGLNYHVVNIDCMVFLERPKLKPYIEAIRSNIAQLLNVKVSQVSVKATTGEGVGIVGSNVAIVASSTVLLEQKTSK
jgi:2-C-methyl-D-erythritol 2,4-cyclodiphosphate synthase